MPARKNWTRHELLILLNVYHKMRFGQMHERNPAIIHTRQKVRAHSRKRGDEAL